MGQVVRITLRLTERFWASEWYARQIKTEELDTLSFLHTSDEHFPVWWTAYPVRAPVLVGWHGGPGAHELSRLASEQIEAAAIESLGRQFRVPARRVRGMVEAAWMHDWTHDPFARGAYSDQTVGGEEAPRGARPPAPRHAVLRRRGDRRRGAHRHRAWRDRHLASRRRRSAAISYDAFRYDAFRYDALCVRVARRS